MSQLISQSAQSPTTSFVHVERGTDGVVEKNRIRNQKIRIKIKIKQIQIQSYKAIITYPLYEQLIYALTILMTFDIVYYTIVVVVVVG